MSSRRSTELRPVPEDERQPSANGGAGAGAAAAAGRGGGSLLRGGGSAGLGGSPVARDGGGGGGGSGTLSHASTSRLARVTRGGGPSGALGRTSIVMKLQQSGKQLIDIGRLQANWLSNTLVKRSDAQDYINEEDQGLVALLARHVDIPPAAWTKLLGAMDGHFWQSGYTPGDFLRSSLAAGNRDDEPSSAAAGPGAAERADSADQLAGKRERLSIFFMPVIQPYNLFAVLWTLGILALDLTYTAFWVPMNVAFCTAEYGKLSSGCTSSDLVGGVLYFLNVLLGFQIGVVATNGIRKRTVVDGRLVAGLYVRYGKFWLDFVASVPLLYLIVVLAGQGHFQLNKGWVNCLSLLRLLRMVRLLSITKVVYMDSLSGRFQDSWLARWLSVTVIYSILLAYQLAVAINLFACMMILCAYFEGYENSWMTAVNWVNVPEASPIYQWYCAVYWMIVTATTTGFGDFQPRSLPEQVIANVAMVGGMIMFGVLVVSIGQALAKATREALQAYNVRQRIMHVMDWAEHRNLPDDLKKQVQNFFTDKYGRKEDDAVDVAMMSVLPSRLRAKVAQSICTPLLAAVDIFRDLQAVDLQTLLAESMKPMRLPAGEDLCQQGDVTNCMWILQEGIVQAVRYKEEPMTLDAAEMPRLLGESVLLGERVEACRVRPWTLRTVTPCRLWGITLGELYPLMRIYPVIGEMAAEHVKLKIINDLRPPACAFDADLRDKHWCEVSAVIVRHLQESISDEEADDLIFHLAKTSAKEGTLQPFLEQLLESCAARRVGGGAGGQGRPTSVTYRDGRGSATAAGGVPTRGTAGGIHPSGGGAGGTGIADVSPSPVQHQQLYTSAAAMAGAAGQPPPNTAFGTAAAAAALSAALMGPMGPGGQLDGGAQPRPLSYGLDVHASGGGGGGGGGAGPYGAARTAPQLAAAAAAAAASPISAVGPYGSSGGGGGPATMIIQCPGCLRGICPGCGQGTDPPSAVAAVGSAAEAVGVGVGPHGAAALLSGGGAAAASAAAAAAGRGNPTPGTRAWINRHGTLRRVSIGMRADQVWASERRSLDKRLGAMSVMSVYD